MTRGKIVDAIKSGRVFISDGAWGTFLYKKGLQAGECPESWCLKHYNEVTDIAKSYINAGADMIETNSFGGTCYKLKHFGLSEKTSEINEAAAKASRNAAGEDKWVIASIGPTGKMLITEEITEEEMYEAFKVQAVALEKGGADAVCIETMSDLEEATLAIKATKENTHLEIICTFSFELNGRGEYRTMMGLTPESAILGVAEAGADISGTNCGNGMERMIDIVKQMRAVNTDMPILVHANAGLPINIDGNEVFPETPEDMANQVAKLLNAGANIIGGCCGTTPEHITAMKRAAEAWANK